MSQIIVSEFMTLDGVMENPMWSLDYWNDDIAAFKHDELFSADALLLGRVTYDGFVASWPTRSGDDFTDRINSMPKHVASRTLKAPEWNSRVLGLDMVANIRNLRQQPGGDLLVYGSRTLVKTLIENDLVDRYNILVYPFVLGEGLRMFDESTHAKLKLVESKAYDTGAVLMIYEPNRDA
jgi:dihydrofolate reductase